MSVKSFKFVSPGVFINEIDNSFVPKSADAIGPVVIGRSRRGLAMQPVKVQSYSEFVEAFGETQAGMGGGDVYRYGNHQSPMYGTYAAKAFLRSNVAPLTYIRLLGQQDSNNDASTAGQAGWKTKNSPNSEIQHNGGAYGLWIWPSSSSEALGGAAGTPGALAAIWYANSGSVVTLSGTVQGGGVVTGGVGWVIANDTNNAGSFTVEIVKNSYVDEKIRFNLDDSSDLFIRKRFNTNPQLASDSGTFYPAASHQTYWLGETFEQEVRDGLNGDTTFTDTTGNDLTSQTQELHGVILPIAQYNAAGTGPHNMLGMPSQEAKAGWFIGQDLGLSSAYVPQNMQKLFRLKGRGHGEWLQRNCKVSIERVRKSTSTASEYGTFSVVIRSLSDTDNNIQVMERFDGCSLDPASPSFVARKIGDKYTQWDTTTRRLKVYGEYANLSKYVYVEMNTDVEGGATDPELLPFGYFGPPRLKSGMSMSGSGDLTTQTMMVFNPAAVVRGSNFAIAASAADSALFLKSTGSAIATDSTDAVHQGNCRGMTGSLAFPVGRLRLSASDGGLADPTEAFFGFQPTRTNGSTRFDPSVWATHRAWTQGQDDDPIGTSDVGFEGYAYVFSLDDVLLDAGPNVYYYASGSRLAGTSVTSGAYGDILTKGYDSFTAPFFGGFDGFDITVPDPLYNKGIPGAGGSGTGTASDQNSAVHYTYKRGIDTVADPEMLDMNVLVVPGLTHEALTQHMINVCEDRADAMAIIDLADVYIPPHEARKASKVNRLGTTPKQAADNLRARRIDSSYGATFYPWVQTRDESTGILVWVPPSVAMLGVLGTSEASSDLWFAPAGFNRGGLSDGAAGIPVTSVTEKLTSKERDTLYEARINPIASFPSSGIVVFGQKTLQERQSALDRINVRRLVIFLKKQISILSTQILFEQNVQDTWTRFRGLIEPFLADVKVRFGITEFRLILDESTTTPDLIDQNILYAKIMVKPARSIEYIAIDFVIASTGASFDD